MWHEKDALGQHVKDLALAEVEGTVHVATEKHDQRTIHEPLLVTHDLSSRSPPGEVVPRVAFPIATRVLADEIDPIPGLAVLLERDTQETSEAPARGAHDWT